MEWDIFMGLVLFVIYLPLSCLLIYANLIVHIVDIFHPQTKRIRELKKQGKL